MAIKNYTSKVDIYTSLGEIQDALAKAGACKLMIDYGKDGKPEGVMFALNTNQGMQLFTLPAQVDGVMAVFAKQRIKIDREQAERTAWRNIRDWVLAQMAFVEAGNVQMDEVFLPYLTNREGQTVYQIYQSGQLCLGAGGMNNEN